jgi:predicted outer membrane lipoprotein
MLVVSAFRTCKILSALMACLFGVAALVCLVHTDDIDRAQTAHQEHHHSPASSATHLTLDLHCLVAILPGIVALLWFCLARLYLSLLLSMPVVPAFPPFIPPKALAPV